MLSGRSGVGMCMPVTMPMSMRVAVAVAVAVAMGHFTSQPFMHADSTRSSTSASPSAGRSTSANASANASASPGVRLHDCYGGGVVGTPQIQRLPMKANPTRRARSRIVLAGLFLEFVCPKRQCELYLDDPMMI